MTAIKPLIGQLLELNKISGRLYSTERKVVGEKKFHRSWNLFTRGSVDVFCVSFLMIVRIFSFEQRIISIVRACFKMLSVYPNVKGVFERGRVLTY